MAAGPRSATLHRRERARRLATVGYGVIGSPTGSGPVSLGSSPGTPAGSAAAADRRLAELHRWLRPARMAPSSSGLGHRPLKAATAVQIRSGLQQLGEPCACAPGSLSLFAPGGRPPGTPDGATGRPCACAPGSLSLSAPGGRTPWNPRPALAGPTSAPAPVPAPRGPVPSCSATSWSRSGTRRPYKSSVMAAGLWPSICWTTFTSAPAAMASDAAVCLSSCGCKPGPAEPNPR